MINSDSWLRLSSSHLLCFSDILVGLEARPEKMPVVGKYQLTNSNNFRYTWKSIDRYNGGYNHA